MYQTHNLEVEGQSSMLIIKHLKPFYRATALQGCIQIASHDYYNKIKDPGGFLDDEEEGMGSSAVWGPVRNFTGFHSGATHINCTYENSNKSAPTMLTELASNRMLYCGKHGAYDVKSHIALMEGTGDQYKGNAEATGYIVYDVDRLKAALKTATDEHFGVNNTNWVYPRVRYGERHQHMPSSQFRGIGREDERKWLFELAFTKPKRFSLEQEGRFAMEANYGLK